MLKNKILIITSLLLMFSVSSFASTQTDEAVCKLRNSNVTMSCSEQNTQCRPDNTCLVKGVSGTVIKSTKKRTKTKQSLKNQDNDLEVEIDPDKL